MTHFPAVTDLAALAIGVAMVAAAAPGAPVALVLVAVLAVLTGAITTARWPSTLAVVTCVVLTAAGQATPLAVGVLLLGYLLLADRRWLRLAAYGPPLTGAVLAVLVTLGADLLPRQPSIWLVLAACLALPTAVALASHLPTRSHQATVRSEP